MRWIPLFLLVVFLGAGCASSPDVVVNGGAEPPGVLEEDDLIAKEVEEAVTLEKMVDRLYTQAYEDYLSGNYERAIASFETAKILNAPKMEFWKKLALSYCYISTGRYMEAQGLSKELIQEKPDYWGSYFNAGLALLWQKKINTALTYLEQADDFKDHDPAVNFYVGMARHLLGRKNLAQASFTEAERAYQEIMKKNPEDEEAHIELAYLRLYRDDKIESVGDLLKQARKLIENSDEVEKKQVWLDFYIPHLEGIYHYKRQEYHRSILIFGAAIEKVPSGIKLDLAESYYFLAKNYQALRDPLKAQLFFRRAISIDPLVPYAQDIQANIKH